MKTTGYAPLGTERQCMAPNLESNEATQAVGNDSPWHEAAPRGCEWRVIACRASQGAICFLFHELLPFLERGSWRRVVSGRWWLTADAHKGTLIFRFSNKTFVTHDNLVQCRLTHRAGQGHSAGLL